MYINDLCNVSSLLFFFIYADNTKMFVTGKNIDNLICLMNTELKKVIWMPISYLLKLKKKLILLHLVFPISK